MYEDQPVNDFKSLFLRLQGELAPQLLCYGKLKYHIIDAVNRTLPPPPSPSPPPALNTFLLECIVNCRGGVGKGSSANYIFHCVSEQ